MAYDRQSPSAPKNVAGVERRREIVRLRAEGLSLAEIGERVGVTHQAVSKSLRVALVSIRHDTEEAVAELREREGAALQTLADSLWPAAVEGKLGHVDRWLRVTESRRKLLGLDMTAPEASGAGQVVVINTEPHPLPQRAETVDGELVEDAGTGADSPAHLTVDAATVRAAEGRA